MYSPIPCYRGVPVLFDASSSHSTGDTIATYAWQFGDGSTGRGRTIEHVFSSPGQYSVELTIVTEEAKQAFASRKLTILHGLVVPSAYPSIQAAIDAATDGETVVVMPGTYRENIRIRGKRITVQSSDPDSSGVVRSTVIQGAEEGRPTVRIGSGSEATLAGFTLLAGPLEGYEGAKCGACFGIVYIREASPTVRKNRIVNSPDTGIAIYESGAKIEGNIISNNSADLPGGAIVVDSYRVAPRITRNTFEGNSATSGGAIFITSTAVLDPEPACAAMTIVTGNVFRSNTATRFSGGAIFVEYVGNLRLDSPDSNTYVGNEPDDVFYVVPPS